MSEEGTYIRCECGNHIRVPTDAAGMMVGPNSFCGQCGREGSFEIVQGAHDDPYGHRGKGGVWDGDMGPCVCKVCEEERR